MNWGIFCTRLNRVFQLFQKFDSCEETEESKQSGAIGQKVYFQYFRAGANYFCLSCLLIVFLSTQVIFSGSDIWLVEWTKYHNETSDSEYANSAYWYAGKYSVFI